MAHSGGMQPQYYFLHHLRIVLSPSILTIPLIYRETPSSTQSQTHKHTHLPMNQRPHLPQLLSNYYNFFFFFDSISTDILALCGVFINADQICIDKGSLQSQTSANTLSEQYQRPIAGFDTINSSTIKYSSTKYTNKLFTKQQLTWKGVLKD